MSHRLLVVEDDPSNSRLFRLICEAAGYQVSEATNGYRALEMVQSEPFDVVLMDLQIPGVDGLSVTRAIKARAETAHLPVIIATARVEDAARASLHEAGAVAVLLKPFTRRVLIDCLDRVLRGS